MTCMSRAALLAGACSAAFATLATPAAAQQAAEPEPARLGVDTITVTAQRRAEDVQDVPIAITPVSAEEIQRQAIEERTDLRFTSPTVNIQKNTGLANAAQVYIRGVGQDESSLFAEVGVGIYLDGVYLGKQNGSTIDLVDVERVEILRGPRARITAGTPMAARYASSHGARNSTIRAASSTFRWGPKAAWTRAAAFPHP